MTYCGYVVILIVSIFIVIIILLLFVIVLFMIILINFGGIVISMKLFNVGFFGEFEILLTIWRLLFLFMVFIIRRRVIIFSVSYIARHKIYNFIFLYLRFIVSIIWLVLNNNFYWIICGWDGSGVVSFLLIVFYMNIERINNGLFTLFQNRLGDLFFVLFILGIIDFSMWNNQILKWGIIFLLIGRCVKRAQFPFNSWLLSAIRAPTPISSLVHSSTLVVAGVYILLQFRYCLVDVISSIKVIRVLRLILRSLGLLWEFDIKKLIAYSTISHVSLILYMLSFKLYKIVYFHLNIHAIFKSLMFMCFGFVILCSFHSQDKRLVSLVNLNPLVKVVYYFSCFCLAGLPFLRAFFSKDFMIEKLIENSDEILYIILLILFLGVRIYYSLNLLKLSFYHNVYTIIEKNYLGITRVFFMVFIMIVLVNVYIRLLFRVRLEFVSYKIRIYFLVMVFGILSLMSNINYKFNVYDKAKNFFEVWYLNVKLIDQFMYWNFFFILNKVSSLSSIKMFVLINWWVIILFIVFF